MKKAVSRDKNVYVTKIPRTLADNRQKISKISQYTSPNYRSGTLSDRRPRGRDPITRAVRKTYILVYYIETYIYYI